MLPFVFHPLHEFLAALPAATLSFATPAHFSQPILFSSSLYLGSERRSIGLAMLLVKTATKL
jgi:hypothetical protein